MITLIAWFDFISITIDTVHIEHVADHMFVLSSRRVLMKTLEKRKRENKTFSL